MTGTVVWFTGRPASGKSTLARAVRDQLRIAGIRAQLLDGDDVRELVTPSLGHSDADREKFYETLAGLAASLANTGDVVLVPATAHKRAYRARARELAPRFVEVYVATPSEECARRDPKKLYAAVEEGRISGLPGADVPYEEPEHPDIVARGGHDPDAIQAAVAAAVPTRRWTVSDNNTKAKRFKVVVAYDFSDLAELALERAIGAAQGHPHADLHVIGVLELGHNSTYKDADTLQREITSVVDAKIEKPTTTDMHLFVHVRIGHAAKEVLDLAAEANADVIILGTHGRQGLRRWLMGSVAEKVVRHAGCPVLVVREKSYYEEPEVESTFTPEPPCERCVATRAETDGAEWWCEAHAKPHAKPHTYRYRATTEADVGDYGGSILW